MQNAKLICCISIHNNEPLEGGIKKIILLATSSKRAKYLGVNLTKEVKDVCLVNYKTLMKEIEMTKQMKAILWEN